MNCVTFFLAKVIIITSVGKVWACRETDVQKMKRWLLRDTCSTELRNYRNVVFWCEMWRWFSCNTGRGLEHLVWDFPFMVKFLSCLPWAGQLCSVTKGSYIMCYLVLRCLEETGSRWQIYVCFASSGLSRQLYDIPSSIFLGRTPKQHLLHETAKGYRRHSCGPQDEHC